MKKQNTFYLLAMLLGLSLACVRLSAYDVQAKYHQPTPQECDSIYLSNSKAFAVKNLVTTQKDVSFQFCEDVGNRTQTVPWQQLKYIRKADGTILTAPAPDQIAADRKASQKHAPHPFRKRNQGIVLLAFGVLGTIIFWGVLFSIAYSDALMIFILVALLGYSLLMYLFKTAFTKLMPHKRKGTRNILTIFSPLLVPVIIGLVVGIIVGIVSLF